MSKNHLASAVSGFLFLVAFVLTLFRHDGDWFTTIVVAGAAAWMAAVPHSAHTRLMGAIGALWLSADYLAGHDFMASLGSLLAFTLLAGGCIVTVGVEAMPTTAHSPSHEYDDRVNKGKVWVGE